MVPTDDPDEGIDWRLTTWEGARREQLRRWAELPLKQIILAQEEMQELAERFQATSKTTHQQDKEFPPLQGEGQGGDGVV